MARKMKGRECQNWTQGLKHAKRMLYHWTTQPAPNCLYILSSRPFLSLNLK
jgi:hypothetical protein